MFQVTYTNPMYRNYCLVGHLRNYETQISYDLENHTADNACILLLNGGSKVLPCTTQFE